MRVRPRVYARAKIKNALNHPKFCLHTFQAIWSIWQKITLTRMRARFLRVLAFCNIESPNFLYLIWHIFPSILITCSSFNNAMSVRQSWQCARTCVIFIHNTWAKTCLYKILCNPSEKIGTPNIFSYLDRLWVVNMICLIWPSINSWRHHNVLQTQKFNLDVMTSAYFLKIDCISVNIDWFSFKFRYVLAETILYK